jgi:hypothetical protein
MTSILHLLHPFGVRIIEWAAFPGVPFGHPRLFILGRFAAPWCLAVRSRTTPPISGALGVLGRFAAPSSACQRLLPPSYLAMKDRGE